jgi:hypothetical protein
MNESACEAHIRAYTRHSTQRLQAVATGMLTDKPRSSNIMSALPSLYCSGMNVTPVSPFEQYASASPCAQPMTQTIVHAQPAHPLTFLPVARAHARSRIQPAPMARKNAWIWAGAVPRAMPQAERSCSRPLTPNAPRTAPAGPSTPPTNVPSVAKERRNDYVCRQLTRAKDGEDKCRPDASLGPKTAQATSRPTGAR